MAKVAGSMWVDGSTLHYVDKVGNEWYFTGDAGTTPAGAIKGSVWVDSTTGKIHYIDFSGVDRSVKLSAVIDRSGVGAKKGSLWIETSANTNYSLHTINNNGFENASHTDVPHADVASSHSDVAASHSDVTTGHSDGTVGHGDATTPNHADCAHHDYHFDGNISDFDLPGHHDWNPYSDHEDWPHGDASSGHGDAGHTDHEDDPGGSGTTSGALTPSASGGYTDSHFDCTAGGGSHTDIPAGHSDVPAGHSDVTTAHSDTTIAHSDVVHTDQPTSLGT